MEDPPKDFKRLRPGGLIRLRYAYIIRCEEILRNADGTVRELVCSYVPESKSGTDTSGLKPPGRHPLGRRGTRRFRCACRLYDAALQRARARRPTISRRSSIPGRSRKCAAWSSRAIAASTEPRFQFERLGYFCKDTELPGVFNRTVSLRDSWKPGGGK